MKKSKRLLAVTVAGVMALTVFSFGVGSQSVVSAAKSNGKKTIVSFWDNMAGPDRTPVYMALIKEFNEKNPDIEVQYSGIPWDSAKQKFDVAIASGEVPDVAVCAAAWGSDWIAEEAVEPLDRYFNKWSGKNDMAKQYVALNRGLSPNRKLYFIPDSVATPMLWIRSDLFKSAGLKPPATWDDFFKAIKLLTDKSKNRYGFSIRGGSGSCVEFQHLMYAYSGIPTYFDKNDKCTIDNPLNVEFAKKYFALYKTYTPEMDITAGLNGIVANFDGGMAAIIAHNNGSAKDHAKALKPDQYQAVAFPVSKAGTHSYTSGAPCGYTIFKKSKVKDAAWKFISFMAGTHGNSYFNRSIGQVPTNTKVLTEDWVNEQPQIQLALSLMADKKTRLVTQPKYLPDYSNIMEKQMPPLFQSVMAGRMTPEAFLKTWADKFTEAKAQYDQLGDRLKDKNL